MAEIKKMTKKDFFIQLRGMVADRQDLVDFIDHELELLDRKSSKSSETKTQIENKSIMETILSELTRIARPITISELQSESDILKEYSNQKLSALLKKLVDSNQVVKTTDKKKSYFSIQRNKSLIKRARLWQLVYKISCV